VTALVKGLPSKDYPNLELAALGEKLYWYEWALTREVERTERSSSAVGEQVIIVEDDFEEFCKQLDLEDVPSSSSAASTAQFEPWKLAAISLGKRKCNADAKAGKLENLCVNYLLRLNKLEAERPMAKAQGLDLLDKQLVYITAREAFDACDASCHGQIGSKSLRATRIYHA
jgi:hypothetical protein